MSSPFCLTLGVSNMGFTVATFKGKCTNMGGLPTKLLFGYDGIPSAYYQRTPSWDVPYEGWEKTFVQTGLNYSTRHNMFCRVENEDGSWNSGSHVFWLPRPEDPLVGSPFLVLHSSGIFDNGTYSFVAITDVGCHLTAYVGVRKPYINQEINETGGASFRHDPGLVFNWLYQVEQSEAGDTLAHTFVIPYTYQNVTYWFVLLGTVDGYPSPSISPFFKFRRLKLPILDHVPAFAITHESAYIGGKLMDDQGQGVYLQLRYTKVEEYTDYLTKVGPYRSMWQVTEKIEELDPETEYKFSIIGSHDKDMVRYGYSEPGFFTTLETPMGPEQTYKCYRCDTPSWGVSMHADWSTARAGSNYQSFPIGTFFTCFKRYLSEYQIYRAAHSFDTSIVPTGSHVNSIRFFYRCRYDDFGLGPEIGTYPIWLSHNDWNGQFTLENWQAIVDLPYALFDKWYPAFTSDTNTFFDLDESKWNLINIGTKTSVAVLDKRDRLNNDPGLGCGFFLGYMSGDYTAYIEIKANPPL